jgi:hypothetical protein
VTLEDAQGNELRTFRHEGTTFVLGYLGERYNVRITNHGERRVEAVLTVDGRDAVSGAPGDFVHQRGYLVAPHGSVVIDGFRRSLDQTAAFRFSRPGESYSSRMGSPENVGVIGVAFFPERRALRPRPPVRTWDEEQRWHAPWERRRPSTRDDAYGGSAPRASEGAARGEPAAPSARPPSKGGDAPGDADLGAPREESRARKDAGPSRLGTEYGESTWSPVTEVRFERQDPWHPDTIASVRYDDADARGAWSDPVAPAPDPFPASRFAPPPP